jgi:drug/metabolite transporter (DMT)-like permease
MTLSLPARPLGIAGLLLATSAWGSLFLVGKPVLAHVGPVWFTLIRYSLASLGFAALLLARGGIPWAKLRAHGRALSLLGLLGYGVFSVLVLVGLQHSVPSHGAVIMATMPITTQLVRWLLDGARPSRASLAGTALALAGVVIVSGVLLSPEDGAGASTLVGDLTALAGTLGWIAYTRGSARLPDLDVIEYSGLTALASWPLLLLAAVAGALLDWAPAPSAEDLALSWHALLYIGAVPSVAAILAYNFGVRTLGVVTGTAFLNVVPVSAMLMGAALGSRPEMHELIGVAMVVAALLVHTRSQAAASAGRVQAADRPRPFKAPTPCLSARSSSD